MTTIYASVLPPVGTPPFKQAAPGELLRVSESATLIEFSCQPTQLIAQRLAAAYGCILWAVSGVSLHDDDWLERVVIETIQEFNAFIRKEFQNVAQRRKAECL